MSDGITEAYRAMANNNGPPPKPQIDPEQRFQLLQTVLRERIGRQMYDAIMAEFELRLSRLQR